MLPIHKKLLIFTIIVLVAALAVYLFWLRPMARSIAAAREVYQEKAGELRREGFSLDSSQLVMLENKLKQQQRDLARQLSRTYDRAMAQFGDELRLFDYSVARFREHTRDIDYQILYTDVQDELARKGIHLDGEILGLTQDSRAPSPSLTYQLRAHLWVVRDLALLAHRHNLDLREYVPGGEPEKMAPALISVKPVRSYAVSPEENVFVDELPVALTVWGTPVDLAAFLADLTSAKESVASESGVYENYRFMPLDTIGIEKSGIDNPRGKQLVRARLVCSGFLILKDKTEFQVKVTQDESTNVPTRRPGI